jgi:hypothetical protein
MTLCVSNDARHALCVAAIRPPPPPTKMLRFLIKILHEWKLGEAYRADILRGKSCAPRGPHGAPRSHHPWAPKQNLCVATYTHKHTNTTTNPPKPATLLLPHGWYGKKQIGPELALEPVSRAVSSGFEWHFHIPFQWRRGEGQQNQRPTNQRDNT